MSSRVTHSIDVAAPPAVSLNNARRLAEVRRYSAFGPGVGVDLDRIARLAANIAGTKIAFISFVLDDKVLLKVRYGSTLSELDISQSICGHVANSSRPLVVTDLSSDDRFESLDLVRGGLRFYAAVPLVTKLGFTIGALCVLDSQPRENGFAPDQLDAMQALGGLILRILSGDQAEQRWHDYLEIATDWVWEQDSEFRFTFFSSDISETVPVPQSNLLGHTRWELMGIDPAKDPLWASHKACLEARQAFRDFRYSAVLGGKHLSISISGKPIFDPDRGFVGYRGVARDVTLEEVVRRRVEYLAHHDHLTGLSNRANFEHQLNTVIEAASTSARRATVFLLDLDKFKDVNDTRGHSAGDAMLIEVGRRLRDVAGPEALVARLGGDEFALLFPDTKDDTDAVRVAESIIAVVSEPCAIGPEHLQTGCSIGIAHIPDNEVTASHIVGNADLALYEAKLAGRRRFRFFDAAMRQSAESVREIATEFAAAIERGELELYYQPQIKLFDRSVVGFEALIRWNHPQRGLLLPAAFKSAIDDGRLSVAAGRWVIETATRQCRAWAESGTPVRVAINLSQAQFRDDDLPALIEQVLSRHGVARKLIELEVTENILLDHVVDISEPLKALSSLGISIALDDFGTGYASLSHLRRFPIDRIKIDRQFVRDIGRRADGATISQAIVSLGKSLGLAVTAEGIESQEQELFLRLSGCDEVQGFFYGRPMPAHEATRYLQQPRSMRAVAG